MLVRACEGTSPGPCPAARASPPAGAVRCRLARCSGVEDLAAAARRRLPAAARAYLEGGGGDEATLRRNRDALDAVELLPQVLCDVSDVDVSTTILGTPATAPIALAPVGTPRLLHHEGELAAVRAAAAAGLPYAISTVGSVALHDVAREADATLWLQLYLWRDRGPVRELVDRATELGCAALVVTVDAGVRSKRDRELRAGLDLPTPRPTLATMIDAALHPSWSWHFLTSPLPAFPNVAEAGRSGRDTWDALSALFDGTTTWDDIAWLRERWSGPLVVKGVVTGEAARRAAYAGADAVVVSNHGGRQLDRVPATIEALPEVLDAAGDAADVLLDSGIRRGTDIVAALATGARAVLIGRSYLYGLSVAGEPGVRHAIDILVDELRTAMALLGVASVAGLGPDRVSHHHGRP